MLGLTLGLMLSVALAAAPNVSADQPIVRSRGLALGVGDSLIVQSNHASIQKIFLEGNVSSANLTEPASYPASNFGLSAFSPGTYELKVLFEYPEDYTIHLLVRTPDTIRNSSAFYLSAGQFELDVNATFRYQDNNNTATVPTSIAPWDSFANWMGKFGQAFPIWVRLLYLVLGVQFFAVGGLWIRREASRRESGTQRLDAGDKAYLWLDVLYKFLLVSFVAIVAIMGGELLILFVLQFMFLASLDLLSLWDLFVVGFAAGALVIVYLSRFILEKAFDLKPIEDE